MPRSDLLRPTFRLKLLLALLGTITPLLLVTLLVVRREADQQVNLIVETTANRAGDAIARIERIRQQQLDQLGARFANSNRWGAALQQALEGDTTLLVEQTRYELEFAGFPKALAAFTNLSGDPVLALVGGARLADPATAISVSAADRLLAGDTAVFGYHVLGRRLYSIHPTFLNLVSSPIGILMLGFAIDDETARSLGQALSADVCFVAKRQCVASSTGLAMHELETFAQSAGRSVEHVTVNGKPYAKVARALGGAESGAQVVLRIPLEEVVRPFTKIQRSIRGIGLAVLLLAIAIATILSRGLARPVRALVAATVRVARGEYETHVPVTSKDEIGMLAGAFNEMTRGLLLKEKYRGVLDKVVSRDIADEMLKGDIQLGGETREVTTLFADVRGFTAMSEGMPPHDIIALLNQVMDRAEAAVVAEGGVIDKYVGDEIMALFGAPVSRGNDALNAVRAALCIQQEVATINEHRVPSGRPPVKIGIGINTGYVVAGNMGSARRLNYTVLGAPVNLTARLCSAAAPSQILISGDTLEQVKQFVEVRALGSREMKGISRAVEIYEVIGLRDDVAATPARMGTITGLLAALLCSATTPVHAQRTLEWGRLQVQPSARVDVLGFLPDSAPAWLIPETGAFLAGRASGFFDIFYGRHLYGLAEVRLDRGEAPSNGSLQIRIEQAFVRVTPSQHADVSIQAGRFVSPFGNYTQRHHSVADPLIRPPLMYDYRTVISARIIPGNNNAFINWKDSPGIFRPNGLPPVWAAPYQLGAMILGTYRKASYRLAAINGAPSAEPRTWNVWPGEAGVINYVAHVGLQLTPELRVGSSLSHGSYLEENAQPLLPPGQSISDYHQRMLGIEAVLSRGFVELRGEVIHDKWDVARVRDDPVDFSYYGEAKVKVAAGAFVSGRYSAIGFNELARDGGQLSPWDYDIRRWQFGAAYRLWEPFEVRGELMLNHTNGPVEPRDNLFSLQASWTTGR